MIFDEDGSNQSGNASDGDSASAEESEDEDLELLREYEKLKREKEAERQKAEFQRMQEIEHAQQQDMLSGNPLLQSELNGGCGGGGDFSLQRKWHEETVFKN